ncbi:hypothetical protein D3C75_992180 [compost metagenome]
MSGLPPNPITPKWSATTAVMICPATTSTRKPAAPSLGVSAAAPATYNAPSTPPTHSHQGPCKALAMSGAGTLRISSAAITTSELTVNDVNAPHNQCPSARPTAALPAAWNGSTAPASNARAKGSTRRHKVLLNMAVLIRDRCSGDDRKIPFIHGNRKCARMLFATWIPANWARMLPSLGTRGLSRRVHG